MISDREILIKTLIFNINARSDLFRNSFLDAESQFVSEVSIDIEKLFGVVNNLRNIKLYFREPNCEMMPSSLVIFHYFGVIKMSTKLTWELNTQGLALGWPPDTYICCITPRELRPSNEGCSLYVPIFHRS